MYEKRSDLAAEIIKMKKTDEKDGIKTEEFTSNGILINKITVKTNEAAEKIGKPCGTYITVDLSGVFSSDETHTKAVDAIAEQLKELIGEELSDSAMIVGLGNSALTSDAIGPQTVSGLIVTRHLKEHLPEVYSSMPLRETSAFLPGVLGHTGIESAETVKAIAEKVKPKILIIIDALASRRTDRLCSTVQISNTGINPGSGVENNRKEISEKTVGIPVIAIGIPTVVDATTLALDIFDEISKKLKEEKRGDVKKAAEIFEDFDKLSNEAEQIIRKLLSTSNSDICDMMVTPKDIDSTVNRSAKLLSLALNKALHGHLEQEEINALLGQ